MTTAILIAGQQILSSRVLLRSYLNLEKEDMERNLYRAAAGLEQLCRDLNTKSVDWAEWDDTYKFMADRNREYIESNLLESAIAAMQMDLVMLIDNRHQLFYAVPARRKEGLKPPIPADVLASLRSQSLHQQMFESVQGFHGILLHQDTPIMVTVRPILRTDRSGPRRGWLLFARYLDKDEVTHLQERTHLKITMYPIGSKTLPEHCRASLLALQEGTSPYAIRPLNRNQIAGHTLVRDIFGSPIQMLCVEEPRRIYQQGLTNQRAQTHVILISALAFLLVFGVVLEFSALTRISHLGKQVEQIERAGNVHARVRLRGRDELTRLAARINSMLGALEENAEELHAKESELRNINENLELIVRDRTQELEASRAVLENALDGIAELDAGGSYLKTNSAYARIFGYAPEQMIGRHWSEQFPPYEVERLWEAYRDMLRTGKIEVEAEARHPDGSPRHVQIVMTASFDESGQLIGHHRFVKDITERKRLEEHIEHQAFHDMLTGLPNRRLFLDRLDFAQSRARRSQRAIAVLFLDLDNFKIINDSLGHEAGDLLLKGVAERLQESVRPGDTVARLGGDEFTVLLEDLHHVEEAEQVAQRIVACLNTPIHLPQKDVFASGSLGIAYSADVEEDPETLLRNADTAMYHAKTHGKGDYALYDPTMNARVVERMEVENDLRYALERKEFCVYYQPLMNLETGQMTGVEALVRWQHPKKGMISPGVFIPIAEETGLIIPLGYWVMEEACRQVQIWQQEFPNSPPFSVSVNLSGRQLQRDDVVERVREVLEKTGIEPSYLKLEITESMLMTDVEGTVARLNALKALGVKLAIDDFGTGYSSMSALSSFPVDTVKIDRSFINRLGERPEAAAIVAAIVMLSRSLNMSVTGEGVETEDHISQLQWMGIDTGQGYVFSKPLNSQTLGEYLKEGYDTFSKGKFEMSRDVIEQLLRELQEQELKTNASASDNSQRTTDSQPPMAA